jgi:capsid protein
MVDGKGRVLGYEVLVGNNETQPVSRNEMLLVYEPDRYENYRGLSPLRRGMNDARDSQDLKTFEMVAAKIHASLPAVIEGGPVNPVDWGDSSPVLTDTQRPLSVWQLLGGDIPALPPGQKLTALSSQRPNLNVTEFISLLAAQFVMGIGIPPSFILDERLTGPNQRAVNAKAQRKFESWQDVMARVDTWVWVRVIADGIVRGELPAVDGWDKIDHQYPPELSIDAGRDAKNEREDVLSGQMTRKTAFARRGQDWVRETRQTFAEDEMIIREAQALSTRTGVPVEWILAKRGYTGKTAQAGPEEKEDEKKDEDATAEIGA